MTDDTLRRQREATIVDLLAVEQDIDIERLAQVFPRPRYELIGNNRVYDGLEVCARYLKERRNAFPDYRVEPIALHHADDAVIAEAWVTGTHVGPHRGDRTERQGLPLPHGGVLLVRRPHVGVRAQLLRPRHDRPPTRLAGFHLEVGRPLEPCPARAPRRTADSTRVQVLVDPFEVTVGEPGRVLRARSGVRRDLSHHVADAHDGARSQATTIRHAGDGDVLARRTRKDGMTLGDRARRSRPRSTRTAPGTADRGAVRSFCDVARHARPRDDGRGRSVVSGRPPPDRCNATTVPAPVGVPSPAAGTNAGDVVKMMRCIVHGMTRDPTNVARLAVDRHAPAPIATGRATASSSASDPPSASMPAIAAARSTRPRVRR